MKDLSEIDGCERSTMIIGKASTKKKLKKIFRMNGLAGTKLFIKMALLFCPTMSVHR